MACNLEASRRFSPAARRPPHRDLRPASAHHVGKNARPVALLSTVGRKKGQDREGPVTFLADGDRFVVVASNAGRDHHPAWYLNLKAEPNRTIRVGGDRIAVVARDVEPSERAELWLRLTAMYSGYEDYAARTPRVLPVVILEPREPQ